MMLYPAMKDLLEKVPSRYELVNVVACRARSIAREAEIEGQPLQEKPVSIAISHPLLPDGEHHAVRAPVARPEGDQHPHTGPHMPLQGRQACR